MLNNNDIRHGSALDVYVRAIEQLRHDPQQFAFNITCFNGQKISFNLPAQQVWLNTDVAISEELMDAAFVLKIGAILADGIPPSFRKEELEARPSTSGTARDALQWTFSGPPQTGWTLLPLYTQGTWSLVVARHGDSANSGCVLYLCDEYSLSLFY